MRNVECKHRLLDRARAERICAELGATRAGELAQTDTYFRVAAGRLKRRECPGRPPEWIHYHRADRAGARGSDYELHEADAIPPRFGDALEPWVVVRKRRTLLRCGEVRIHLDDVERLGSFLELEALVNERQTEPEAERALASLREALGAALGPALPESYSDLLARRRPARRGQAQK